jgi:hypothetical protein
MNRRKGQNGTVVISGSWYRVRWRLDVEGQEKRINMNEKVAPLVFDRNGNPKPLKECFFLTFLFIELTRWDRPSISRAVGEHRSVMSIPIALETLIWIVLFF